MQAFLQQREGPDDIGLDEFPRTVDRAVDVTLRREIHDGGRSILFEQRTQAAFADIELGKGITWMPRGLRNRAAIRRISELVDIDDKHAGMVEEMTNDGGADEAGAAGYEYSCAVETHDRALMLLDLSRTIDEWTEDTGHSCSSRLAAPG